jgi:tetratricopeptide (TPR) repeat protein
MSEADYYASNPEGSAADYHFKLGESYLAQGEPRKAYLEFATTVQLNMYHQGALLYLAQLFAQTDNEAILKIITRRIRQRDPENATVREIIALRAIRSGNFDKAEKYLKTALKYHPRSLIPHRGLSILYQRRGEDQRAILELQTVLSEQPTDRFARRELADCYWRLKQRDKALAEYDRCLELSPRSLDLRLSLAEKYRAAGLFDRAFSLYKDLRRLAPSDTSILVEMAQTHLMKGDPGAALTCLGEVKKRSKNAVESKTRLLISIAHLQKGDTTRAAAELEEGLHRAPSDVIMRLQLASVYLAQENYTAAIMQYEQVLDVDPESFTAYFHLARAYKMVGKYEEAKTALEHALRLKPNSIEAQNNLAYLYAQLGTNLDRSLQLAQKVNQRLPNQPQVLDTLGLIYYQRGEYNKALKYLTRAKELSQEQPTAARLYHLALVYKQKGMKQKALAELTEALKCHPPLDEAQEIQRVMRSLNGQG